MRRRANYRIKKQMLNNVKLVKKVKVLAQAFLFDYFRQTIKTIDMNKKNLILLLVFVSMAVVTRAQSVDETPRHYLDFGPLAGYNLKTKSPTYGGNANYEYRINKNWGLTAGVGYELTRTDQSDIWVLIVPGTDNTNGDHWNQALYTANAGARYYLGKLFLGASFGLGFEKSTTVMEDGYKYKSADRYGFYQNYTVGYQIPLNNKSSLEVYGGVFGAGALKVGGGVRYKLRLK